VKPNNKTDFVTLLHDIDYLRYAGFSEKQNELDQKAIRYTDYSLPGLATSLGLRTRRVFDLNFNTPIPGYTAQETRFIGQQVWDWLLQQPDYIQYFNKYNIDLNDYL